MPYIIIPTEYIFFLSQVALDRPYQCTGRLLPDGRTVMDAADLNNPAFEPVKGILETFEVVDIDPSEFEDTNDMD